MAELDNNEKIILENLHKLQQLAGERDAIEGQMGRLHLAVRGFCNLVNDKIQRDAYLAMVDRFRVRLGLTDLINMAFDMIDGPLTANEIRSFIRNYGSEHSLQPNLLQSIYTTLTRMRKANEIRPVKKQGEKAFKKISLGERLAQKTTKGKEAAKAAVKVGDAVETRFSFPKYELPDMAAMDKIFEDIRKPMIPDALTHAWKEIERQNQEIAKFAIDAYGPTSEAQKRLQEIMNDSDHRAIAIEAMFGKKK